MLASVLTFGSAAAAPEHTLHVRPVLLRVPPTLALTDTDLFGDGLPINCDGFSIGTAPAPSEPPPTQPGDDRAAKCVIVIGQQDREGKRPVYVLATARFTGVDVVRAHRRPLANRRYAVEIQLTRGGQERFGAMAAALFPLTPPMNRFAVVLDGKVVAAPRVLEPTFSSGTVQVGGSFGRREAARLARQINDAGRLR
jgi:preprotein translocase subunit SecD